MGSIASSEPNTYCGKCKKSIRGYRDVSGLLKCERRFDNYSVYNEHCWDCRRKDPSLESQPNHGRTTADMYDMYHVNDSLLELIEEIENELAGLRPEPNEVRLQEAEVLEIKKKLKRVEEVKNNLKYQIDQLMDVANVRNVQKLQLSLNCQLDEIRFHEIMLLKKLEKKISLSKSPKTSRRASWPL